MPRFLRNGWDTNKISVYTICENALDRSKVVSSRRERSMLAQDGVPSDRSSSMGWRTEVLGKGAERSLPEPHRGGANKYVFRSSRKGVSFRRERSMLAQDGSPG